MDLEAAETSHKKEPISTKKKWACPCAGCNKAVKQERERILEQLDLIDLHAPYQLNVVGLKQLIIEIIKEGGK